MFRALTALVVLIAAHYATGQACSGGVMTQADVDKILKYINDRRTSILKGEQKNGRDSATNNATTKVLPAGSDIAKIEWKCELETQAAAAMGSTCLTQAPTPPANNAAFFAAYDDAPYYDAEYIFQQWTSQIDFVSIADSSITASEVKYENIALRDYANLVRSTTTGIGCTEKRCTGQNYVLYCLTDQPELASGDVIYKVGSGGCTSDTDCNGGTCDTTTGLCTPSASSPTIDCANGEMAKTDIELILKYINDRRVSILKGEQKNGRDSATNNATTKVLPKGKDIAKITWNCDLETQASTAMGSTCLTQAPTAPANNAAFFAAYDDAPYYDIEYIFQQWTSQIDFVSIADSSITASEVKYENIALRDYANLVRSTTTSIGCKQMRCTGQNYVLYCLTDQPELASGDVIYNVGSGGCTADTDCTDGKCDTSTGLCIPNAKPAASTAAPAASTAAPATAEFATSADSSENQRCPTNTGMTDTLRYKFLDMHNYRREILAKGTVQMKDTSTLPKAANMRRMRYNCGMEVKAVEYLKNCPGDASPVSARDGAGENFIRISDTTITNYTAAIQKAVTSWWKVIRTTDGITMDVIYKSNYVGAQISSFTQMAWATTHKLGCAVAKCSADYVAVCRYAPIGNNVQEAIYTIGDPCTVCPTDAWCTYDALCTLP